LNERLIKFHFDQATRVHLAQKVFMNGTHIFFQNRNEIDSNKGMVKWLNEYLLATIKAR
jgi:hypothetical protein